ncbi:hypothetical protein EB796_019904 [Bugula neritina]|uniref:Uncharacterized protein n=1 Tax=Bugula neritina TaxID=10212 RepID=A0A7J7J877_BUGNE|nr:hypothetical protein EB796_019904 [Bugula neritina]
MRPLAAKVIDQDVNSEENWKKVSFMHWPAVFSLYNKSIVGTYITFLPSVKLSLIITAEQASHLKSQSQMFDDPNYEYSSVEDVEDFDLVSPSNSSFLHFIYTKGKLSSLLYVYTSSTLVI